MSQDSRARQKLFRKTCFGCSRLVFSDTLWKWAFSWAPSRESSRVKFLFRLLWQTLSLYLKWCQATSLEDRGGLIPAASKTSLGTNHLGLLEVKVHATFKDHQAHTCHGDAVVTYHCLNTAPLDSLCTLCNFVLFRCWSAGFCPLKAASGDLSARFLLAQRTLHGIIMQLPMLKRLIHATEGPRGDDPKNDLVLVVRFFRYASWQCGAKPIQVEARVRSYHKFDRTFQC